MTKKTFALLGIIFSGILVFLGLLTLCGAMGGDTSYPSGVSYLYDSGYASFGGDFYTYVNNNAAKAASASYTAAANLEAIAILLKNVCSFLLMGIGLMGVCHFGVIWTDCRTAEAVAEAPEEKQEPAPVSEPQPIAVPAEPQEETPADCTEAE